MMFKHKRGREASKVRKDLDAGKFESMILKKQLDENINLFNKIFRDDDTVVYRRFENQSNDQVNCCIIFIDGMINREIVDENIILPIIGSIELNNTKNIIDELQRKVIVTNSIEKSSDTSKLVSAILTGDTILLADGYTEALIISTKGWQTRSIEEPETERVLRGPREGFTESLMINTTLIRRKINTSDLKFKYRIMGVRSNTKVCICYIEGVANLKILNELNRRLDSINIDGILDSGYIQELIRDAPYTPFKTIGSTERPDTVAGKLLEGRIAVIVDGSPAVLTVPHIFIESFQANDDYYISYFFSSIGRFIRIIGFLFSISVPPIYVSLVTFHQEMIPTPLIINISAAREGVPFPTIVEALGMLAVFEILRETGLRMPTFMGQALSIVGALVIGQAAVEARFVSAPMVIVIAFTGITGLMLPKLKGAVLLVRVMLLLLAGMLGLYGYLFGIAGLLIHLVDLRTFGIPFMYKLLLIDPKEEIKDTIIRAPWWVLKKRPRLITNNITRNKSDRSNI